MISTIFEALCTVRYRIRLDPKEMVTYLVKIPHDLVETGRKCAVDVEEHTIRVLALEFAPEVPDDFFKSPL